MLVISRGPSVPACVCIFCGHGQAPKAGWSEYRPLGLGAFLRRSDSCWLGDLHALVAAGFPVIVLQHYSLPVQPGDGHYRVVVGFEEADNSTTLLDPWDRSNDDAGFGWARSLRSAGAAARPAAAATTARASLSLGPAGAVGDVQPRVITLTAADMCALWNHAEPNGNVTNLPFFAAVVAPWTVQLSYAAVNLTAANASLQVTAVVTYVCPGASAALCAGGPVAAGAVANLTLPASLAVAGGGSTVASLGDLAPGDTATAVWYVAATQPVALPGPAGVMAVTAYGSVTASVPNSADLYPGYTYTDLIGGTAFLPY